MKHMCAVWLACSIAVYAAPAEYIPASRVNLLESPYYLPGITNVVFQVPSVGLYTAKAYRIMGGRSGRHTIYFISCFEQQERVSCVSRRGPWLGSSS